MHINKILGHKVLVLTRMKELLNNPLETNSDWAQAIKQRLDTMYISIRDHDLPQLAHTTIAFPDSKIREQVIQKLCTRETEIINLPPLGKDENHIDLLLKTWGIFGFKTPVIIDDRFRVDGWGVYLNKQLKTSWTKLNIQGTINQESEASIFRIVANPVLLEDLIDDYKYNIWISITKTANKALIDSYCTYKGMEETCSGIAVQDYILMSTKKVHQLLFPLSEIYDKR